MSDFYKRITDLHGSVEKLAGSIPGFKGYLERQDRRAADKLLREKVARGLTSGLDELYRVQKRLGESGGMKYLGRTQVVATRLQTLVDKISSAPQGYAGLFDAVKIDEGVLAKVYDYDVGLLMYIDQLALGVRALGGAVGGDGVEAVVSGLEGLVSELEGNFAKRVEVMQGMA